MLTFGKFDNICRRSWVFDQGAIAADTPAEVVAAALPPSLVSVAAALRGVRPTDAPPYGMVGGVDGIREIDLLDVICIPQIISYFQIPTSPS